MEETTPQLSIMLTDSVSGGLSLCSTMSGASVLGDHERLGVGLEQLGWKMHILDCFFTQVAGRLAGTVRRLGSAGPPGQSGYVGLSSMEAAVCWTSKVALCLSANKMEVACLLGPTSEIT